MPERFAVTEQLISVVNEFEYSAAPYCAALFATNVVLITFGVPSAET